MVERAAATRRADGHPDARHERPGRHQGPAPAPARALGDRADHLPRRRLRLRRASLPAPTDSCSRTPRHTRSSVPYAAWLTARPILSPSVTRTVLEQMRRHAAARPVGRGRGADVGADPARARGRDLRRPGLSNADIAGELYLSIPTVKAHVSRLFDKLDVHQPRADRDGRARRGTGLSLRAR